MMVYIKTNANAKIIADSICPLTNNIPKKLQKMSLTRGVVISVVLTTFLACVFGQAVTPAPDCTDDIRDNTCVLPNCRCSGSDIPGNLSAANIPQLVFLTFDDAVNIDNYLFYEEVLFNRKNPNSHPITASFFITHEYTNYSQVHELWRRGNDISLHSITHNPNTVYWKSLNDSQWRQEIVQQRDQLSFFARVPTADVKGIRAPFLQMGGDVMYNMLKTANFKYDCSRPSLNFRKPGMWPYTNDYKSTQDCQIEPCPVGQYPGFWTVPMLDMIGDNGEGCAMVDACVPLPDTEAGTYDLLLRNFEDHYKGNRAPYGIFAHAGWLNGTDAGAEIIWERRKGYIKFLDYLDNLDDVYIVSISRALEWIQNPTPLANITTFPSFHVTEKATQCPRSQSCRYDFNGKERWLHSCAPCPAVYPWLGNPLGRP